jgi:hypothetical protein
MDLVFRPAEPLRRLYPKLVQLGMTSFSSADVMRFLGKKTTLQGERPWNPDSGRVQRPEAAAGGSADQA